MTRFYLNPLSANAQCPAGNQCEEVIRKIIHCFAYCNESLAAGTVSILFDSRVYERSLSVGIPLVRSLNNLRPRKGGPDLARLWFWYTRNRATQLPPGAGNIVTVRDPANPIHARADGLVHRRAHASNHWLGFSSDALFDLQTLEMLAGAKVHLISSVTRVDQLEAILPRFEANRKHRKQKYRNAKGELVSAMPVSDVEAQKLLFRSQMIGTERWARCAKTQGAYCFKRTYPTQEVFHGFLVEKDEIPQHIQKQLRNP